VSLLIKAFRKKNNLTQAELGVILGVSTNCITQWETGVRCPSISKLCEIAQLFGCSLDDLVGNSDTDKRGD